MRTSTKENIETSFIKKTKASPKLAVDKSTATTVDAGPHGKQDELGVLWMSWTVLLIPGLLFTAFVLKDLKQRSLNTEGVRMRSFRAAKERSLLGL